MDSGRWQRRKLGQELSLDMRGPEDSWSLALCQFGSKLHVRDFSARRDHSESHCIRSLYLDAIVPPVPKSRGRCMNRSSTRISAKAKAADASQPSDQTCKGTDICTPNSARGHGEGKVFLVRFKNCFLYQRYHIYPTAYARISMIKILDIWQCASSQDIAKSSLAIHIQSLRYL